MKLKVFIFFAMMVALATGCFAIDHCNGIESGVVYYNEGEFDRAIDEWRTCEDYGVKNSDLYYNLGNAYFRSGKLGFAIYYYKTALRLDPNNDDIIHNLKYAQSMTRDKVEEDGSVHDPYRIDYFREHIRAMGEAVDDGADLSPVLVGDLRRARCGKASRHLKRAHRASFGLAVARIGHCDLASVVGCRAVGLRVGRAQRHAAGS